MDRPLNSTASGTIEYITPSVPIPTNKEMVSYPPITYTPATLAELSDNISLNQPIITTITKNGEAMEVRTYQPNPNSELTEIKLMYPRGLQDSKDLDYAKKLYNYAHDIGAKGTRDTAIDLNGFLDWLGYKRDKDNTHDIRIKKTVWRGIYNTSKTDITTQLKYLVRRGKYKNSIEIAVSEQPVISSLVGFYRENGRDIETTEFRENPPYKITLKFFDFFITELQGKKLEGGGYITKNLVIAPKISAGELQGKYQGFAKNLLEFIYLKLKVSQSASGVRNYTKTELVQRASKIKRPNEALNKLVQFLNLFETDGHVKAWGVRQTIKGKQLSKQYRKSPYVWIDFSNTPAFIEIKKFKPQQAEGKKIEKLEQEVRKNKQEIAGLKKKNEDLGV